MIMNTKKKRPSLRRRLINVCRCVQYAVCSCLLNALNRVFRADEAFLEHATAIFTGYAGERDDVEVAEFVSLYFVGQWTTPPWLIPSEVFRAQAFAIAHCIAYAWSCAQQEVQTDPNLCFDICFDTAFEIEIGHEERELLGARNYGMYGLVEPCSE